MSGQVLVDGMIGSLRRRYALRVVLVVGLVVMGALGAVLVGAALVDNGAELAAWVRWCVWGVLVAGVVGAGAEVVRRAGMRAPTAAEHAAAYDRAAGGGRSRLSNSVLYLSSGLAGRDALAAAAVRENVAALEGEREVEGRVYPLRPARWPGVGAGVMAAVLAGYLVVGGEAARNGLARVAMPWAGVRHYLTGGIEVSPGDAVVAEGEGLPVRARVLRSGGGEGLRLEYRLPGSGWTSVGMYRGSGADEGVYTHNGLRAIYQSLEYRVCAAGGELRSETYRVTVLPRPKLEGVSATVTPPAYTGQPQVTLPEGRADVTAVVGSRVVVRMTLSVPVSQAVVRFDDGTFAAAELSDATHGTVSLGVSRSLTWTPELTAREKVGGVGGRVLTSEVSRRYAVVALEDQPPLATVVTPGRDVVMPAKGELPLTIDADDDFGVAEVRLETRLNEGEWKAGPALYRVNAPGEKHRRVETTLPLGLYKTGDSLAYRVVAKDHRQPEANVFTSRGFVVALGEASPDASLVTPQLKELLNSLTSLLALQKEARAGVDMDRAPEEPRAKQKQVLEVTAGLIATQQKSIRPDERVIAALTELSQGPMVRANQLLASYGGAYEKRLPMKAPILSMQDAIIARLQELIATTQQQLEKANKAQDVLAKLPESEREQAMKAVREMLQKLRAFSTEQDKVIKGTEDLARKADNFTGADLQKMEKLAGMQDEWAKVFAGSVKDLDKMLEQGFADSSIHNDYKQMVEQISEAAKDLNPKTIDIVVPREQTALELAKKLAEDMEMWLPNTPDNIRWVMEEPLTKADVPLAPLPDQLSDMVGDLMAKEEDLNEAAEDQTSSWADSISAAGWAASDGPISNFSAKGVTGNQLPNNNEISGRSGDGRGGKSSGQMVSNEARGLDGRKTPARVTNDAYEKGVVKELQQTPTGGATGGGKARGSGQEGLQGSTPPPSFEKMQFMRDWQQRLRQDAQKLAGQLKSVRVRSVPLETAIEWMKKAEQAASDGRYGDLIKAQKMILASLQQLREEASRDTAMRTDPAQGPGNRRTGVLDSPEEPLPPEYGPTIQRYFEALSK